MSQIFIINPIFPPPSSSPIPIRKTALHAATKLYIYRLGIQIKLFRKSAVSARTTRLVSRHSRAITDVTWTIQNSTYSNQYLGSALTSEGECVSSSSYEEANAISYIIYKHTRRTWRTSSSSATATAVALTSDCDPRRMCDMWCRRRVSGITTVVWL